MSVAEGVLDQVRPPRPDEPQAMSWVLDQVAELGLTLPDPELFERLTIIRDRGVTVFRGLELPVKNSAGDSVPVWLHPVIVWGEKGKPISVFHITSIGRSIEDLRNEAKQRGIQGGNSDIESNVSFNFATETSLMLGDQENPDVAAFQKAIDEYDGTPHVIVRMGFSGNIFYPLSYIPQDVPEADILHERMEKLAWVLRLPETKIPPIENLQEMRTRATAFEEETRYKYNHATFLIGKPHSVEASFGRVYVYPIQIQNGKERYVELITTAPIEEIQEQLSQQQTDKNAASLRLRPDSRCERCQINGDEGCGCRVEAVSFLEQGIQTGVPSVLISYPAHDTDGHGTAVGLGIIHPVELGNTSFNGDLPTRRPVSDVARELFGEERNRREFLLGVAAFRLAVFKQDQIPSGLILHLTTSNTQKEDVVRSVVRGARIITQTEDVELPLIADTERMLRRHDPTYRGVDADLSHALDNLVSQQAFGNEVLALTSWGEMRDIPLYSLQTLQYLAHTVSQLRKTSQLNLSLDEPLHSFANTAGDIQQAREQALQILRMGESILRTDFQDEQSQDERQLLEGELLEIAKEQGISSIREFLFLVRRSLDYTWSTLQGIDERERNLQRFARYV